MTTQHVTPERAGRTDPAPLPPPARLLLMVGGKRLSQCIYVAAKLGIADLLADGPRPLDDLAAATGCEPRPLYGALRALAAHGVFAELPDRRFTSTPLAEYLRSDVPGTVRNMAIISGEDALWRPFGHILHTMRTGEPAFTHVFGEDLYAHMEERPELAQAFNDAMTALSEQYAPMIAGALDFSRFGVIADVGGGHGYLLSAILRAHPGVSGVLFDLPHVVAGAQPVLARAGVADRVTAVGGDFFREVPGGADAYLFKTVLHNWSDADAEAILRRVRAAVGERGDARLLLAETVVPPGNDWHMSKLLDIEMLVNVGGMERDEQEWRTLLGKAGFDLVGVTPTVPPLSVIEAAPA